MHILILPGGVLDSPQRNKVPRRATSYASLRETECPVSKIHSVIPTRVLEGPCVGSGDLSYRIVSKHAHVQPTASGICDSRWKCAGYVFGHTRDKSQRPARLPHLGPVILVGCPARNASLIVAALRVHARPRKTMRAGTLQDPFQEPHCGTTELRLFQCSSQR